MRRLLLVTLCLLALVTPAISRTPQVYPIQPLAWTDPDGEVRNHCTTWARRIEVPEVGVFVHWVTAAHCIMGPDREPNLDRDYRIGGLQAHPISWNPELDLAELVGREDVRGLDIATLPAPKVGAEVHAEGYPLGWPERFFTKGYVALTDWRGYTLWGFAGARGMSGAPVLDKSNKVVGLIQITFCEDFCPVLGGATLEQLRFFFLLP